MTLLHEGKVCPQHAPPKLLWVLHCSHRGKKKLADRGGGGERRTVLTQKRNFSPLSPPPRPQANYSAAAVQKGRVVGFRFVGRGGPCQSWGITREKFRLDMQCKTVLLLDSPNAQKCNWQISELAENSKRYYRMLLKFA